MKEIANYKPTLTEGEVKRAINDRLEYAQNQGQLIFLRLNSGDFIEVRGDTRRRVRGCPAGTADYVVFQSTNHTLYYQSIPFGGCEPVSACRVTFLEIKSSKGKQSPEQGAFEILAKMFNCRYFLIRDADELEGILR